MGILIGLLLIGICACIITFLIQLKNSQKKVEQLNGQIHALTEYSETLLEKIRELLVSQKENQKLIKTYLTLSRYQVKDFNDIRDSFRLSENK